MAKKYYAVRAGRQTGVFPTWEQCRTQVEGFSGAIYKGFPTREEAEAFLTAGIAPAGSLSPLAPVSPQKTEEAAQAESPSLGESSSPAGSLSPAGRAACAVAYVDGSYHAATGEFACGAVVFWQGKAFTFSKKFSDPVLSPMRNVAGEIKASEAVMRWCLEHQVPSLEIHHDYEGIARWCTGEWKANKEGTKAYRDFYQQAARRMEIRFVKVKGHSGDRYNDMADSLAKKALGIC